jgi:hypothetical protein
MKKLLLIICFIITGLISKAQDTYSVQRVDFVVWNGPEQKYETNQILNENPVGFYITMKGTLILINDQANSYYVTEASTYRTSENEYVNKAKWWAWQAKDEKQNDCYIQITYNPETLIQTLNVMYVLDDKGSYKVFIYYYSK